MGHLLHSLGHILNSFGHIWAMFQLVVVAVIHLFNSIEIYLIHFRSTAHSPDGIAVQSFKPKGVSVGSRDNVFLRSSNLTGTADFKVGHPSDCYYLILLL